MSELSKKEMEAILLDHEKAELEMDVEATMATLVPNPHYEIAFAGLAVDGWDSVYETYKRILNPQAQAQNVAAKRRVHAVDKNTLVREAHVTYINDQQEKVTGLYMVVMEFDPVLKKISGERMYADPGFAKMMSSLLGDDFANMDGVSRISDSAPVIEEHDAYEVAAARGVHIARR